MDNDGIGAGGDDSGWPVREPGGRTGRTTAWRWDSFRLTFQQWGSAAGTGLSRTETSIQTARD